MTRTRLVARRPATVAAVALTATGLLAAARAGAQQPILSGYYQNVALGSAAGAGAPSAALDAQRVRIMAAPSVGPWSFDAAYEHLLWWRGADAVAGSTPTGGLLSSTQPGDDWLRLDHAIYRDARLTWRHRFDRLSATVRHGDVTLTIGRQAISWATTLFLTPADPFVPLDPSDPFRDYRAGVDAARLQWFAGPFSVVDVVVRPAATPVGRTLTALARGKTQLRGWEMSLWGGAIHDRPGAAAGLTRTVAGSAIRGEVSVRRDTTDGGASRTVVRGALGVDRRWSLWSRDLYVVAEVQHDGFGALHPADLAAAATSPAAARRELQVLGRDEAALQASWQAHPLIALESVAVVNLRDGSTLFGPDLNISATTSISLRLGGFLSAGAGPVQAGPLVPDVPRSEYGDAPATVYAALSAWF